MFFPIDTLAFRSHEISRPPRLRQCTQLPSCSSGDTLATIVGFEPCVPQINVNMLATWPTGQFHLKNTSANTFRKGNLPQSKSYFNYISIDNNTCHKRGTRQPVFSTATVLHFQIKLLSY